MQAFLGSPEFLAGLEGDPRESGRQRQPKAAALVALRYN